MRILLAAAVLGGALCAAVAAQAENRMFIITNDTDYGVDRCLASGASCGAVVAAAYCRSQQFSGAVSFRKVDRDEITGAIPTGSATCRGHCDEFVAIECSR